MKNPLDVLATKENDLARVKKEISALRVVASLLTDETDDIVPEELNGVDLPSDWTADRLYEVAAELVRRVSCEVSPSH